MAHRMMTDVNDCQNCYYKDACEVQGTMNIYGLRCKCFSPHKTHGDAIREKSNEELAAFLTSIDKSVVSEIGRKLVYYDWVEWLNQKAEAEDAE